MAVKQMPDPGDFRHQIEIQERVNEQNSYGEAVDTWPTVERWVWASTKPMTGRELLQAQTIVAEATVKVTCRWFDGLTPAKRFRRKEAPSRIYDILHVANVDEANVWYEVLCKEAV